METFTSKKGKEKIMSFKGSGTLNNRLYPISKKSKVNTNPFNVERATTKVTKTRGKGVYPIIVQAKDI